MAKRRRKTRTHLKDPNLGSHPTSAAAPKSFIIKSGNVGRSVSALVQETRRVMEPNTASKLRERKSNRLRDFLTMAGPLGVTHMLIFGQTDAGTNLRIARCPRGPTVTFRVNKYALAKDVQASSRRPRPPSASDFLTPPLLVLNNFGSQERHVKLLVATFQNLFPPIQVHSMKLSQARRIVLLNYNAATKTIDWRHYLISVRPVGVSKAVRRVIEGTTRASAASSGSISSKRKGRSLVNLGDASDIADYVLGQTSGGGGFETDASEAESEAEDMADPKMKVELHDDYVGRGNVASSQRAVRLREIGPRMELKLIKVVEGLNEGEVLYHDYLKKTAGEEAKQRRELEEKRRLQQQRREEQQRNVERKKREKEERRKEARAAQGLPPVDDDDSGDDDDGAEAAAEEEDDEFEYEDRVANGGGSAGDEEEDDDEELFDEGGSDYEDGDDDEEREEEDDDDEDSDLEPIPLGEMQHDYDSDEPFPEADSDDDDEVMFDESGGGGNGGDAKGKGKKRKVDGRPPPAARSTQGKGKGKGMAKGKGRR
ncbi:rRNA-binding ribosome biosynthesis protein [Thecaphora frezii]